MDLGPLTESMLEQQLVHGWLSIALYPITQRAAHVAHMRRVMTPMVETRPTVLEMDYSMFTKPIDTARATASVRLVAPSLREIAARCFLVVPGPTWRRSEISELDNPRVNS